VSRLAVFGYGSLVSAASASLTLGRAVPPPRPARLHGWRRRWSEKRDNLTCEKTFALADGRCPEWILGLNLEPGEDQAGSVNGVLLELSEAELERLDIREIRYDRVEVTDLVDGTESSINADRIVAYAAKPAHHAPEPPADAVILASYASAIEEAFRSLGPGELDRFRATTGPYPVERAEGTLVRDRIPPGNPRAW
jgi:cation transport regulator ChaC